MAALPRLAGAAAMRNLPWARVIAIAAWVVREGRERWNRLTRREQDAVLRTLRKSRGRRGNVSSREQDELRRLVWKMLRPGAGR